MEEVEEVEEAEEVEDVEKKDASFMDLIEIFVFHRIFGSDSLRGVIEQHLG